MLGLLMDRLLLFPKEWRVSIQITAQVACKQLSLQDRQHSYWRLLADERMAELLTLTLLVSSQYSLARIIGQHYTTAFGDSEVFLSQLATID
ncbi:hypothetical protein A5892_01355 [Halotalea alkalilenta]|uniref:Uncharacterized protein n=1 Tax=Halotalea alkalilenta TaxID=376489 RepID=A0A172YAX0_9GAMM|nr:hypothetical protein A5892_01355 [Halotalea alkalilenta]